MHQPLLSHEPLREGVLITGGGRGLGAALGAELARRGARVLLVARSQRDIDGVVAQIREETPRASVFGLAADVSDQRDTHRIAAVAADTLEATTALIHCASSLGPVPLRPLDELSCEAMSEVFETNVIGPFRLTKALVGHMNLSRRGLVVHVTSDTARAAYPRWGAYGASKAAFDQLMSVWAAELPWPALRFVSVDPGEMDTLMHAEALPDADRTALAKPAAVARDLVAHLFAPATSSRGQRVDRHGAPL